MARRRSLISRVKRAGRGLGRVRRGLERKTRRTGRAVSRIGARTGRRLGKLSRRTGRQIGRIGKRTGRQFGRLGRKAVRRFGPKPARPDYGTKLKLVRGKEILQRNFATGSSDAPRLAIRINARRGKMGLPGLYGSEMREAVEAEYLRAVRAIGFLRAGFLPAVAKFGKAIGKQPGASSQRALAKFGSRGGARIARPGAKVDAELFNEAFARLTDELRAVKIGEDGLQKAINQEVASMKTYIERKLQADANKLVGRFLR